jgi:hypothetical protein
LFEQSQAFDNAIWTKLRINPFGSGSVVNATTAPDGTMTAEYIQQENGQTTVGGVNRQINVVSGIPYTLSVFAKQSDERYLHLFFAIGAGAATLGCNFDLQDGIAGTTTAGTTATIQSVGNGWFRCSVTATSLITGSQNNFIRISNVLNGSTATPNKGIFIWGAQLVEGTDAKPYFATTNRQDVPRLDYRNADGTISTCPRLLLEPQRTNSIRNSTMVGAVAGSPGTLPTNWGEIVRGLTRSVVGVGVVNGINYIDLRFNGTATGGQDIGLDGLTAPIVAALGQSWSLSSFVSLQSGTIPSAVLRQIERTAAGAFLTEGTQTISVTSTLQRFTYTRTTTNASVERITPFITINTVNGATYDFTIRIAAPQMELGATASTFIPTTTAAVTRLADVASKTGVSSLIGQTEGTLFLDFNYYPGLNEGRLISVTESATPVNNRLIINVNSSNNRISVISRQNNTITNGSIGESPATQISAGSNKIALAYKSGSSVLYINGTQVAMNTDSFTFTVALNRLFLMTSEITFTANGLGYENQAALFPTRLTNARLQELTTL